MKPPEKPAMNPFELRLSLTSPIQLGRYLRLDGLLWHVLFLHLGCQEKAKQALGDYLLRANNSSYYHASCMLFGVRAGFDGEYLDNLIATTRSKTGFMRVGSDLSPETMAPNARRGGGYVKVVTTGGPYKQRLTAYPAYYSRKIIFHGHGDGQAITDLMRFYLIALGINANCGHGTIGDIAWTPLDKDISVIDPNGLPSRPIPLDDYTQLSTLTCRTGEAILMPPFRGQPSVMCALPERIRKHTYLE